MKEAEEIFPLPFLMEDEMKKLLLSLILLMVLAGNAFAIESIQYSKGQTIYMPCGHYRLLIPSTGEYQYFTTRITVRNYSGNANVEYIEYYGIEPSTGELLAPVRMNLTVPPSPPNPPSESYALPPWRAYFWGSPQWLGIPLDLSPTRITPFFIIKWVSTNGKKIPAPTFAGNVSITEGFDLSTARVKALLPFIDVMILEDF